MFSPTAVISNRQKAREEPVVGLRYLRSPPLQVPSCSLRSRAGMTRLHFEGWDFGIAAEGGCSGTGTALSSQAVYQRLSSICEPAARRCAVKSKASGEPLPLNPPAFSSA